MREKADQLGWEVWKIIKNPKLSAYKRRKIKLPDGRLDYRVFRPDLREALDDLSAGRANAMLALDLDRAFRDPADLDDLIKVVDNSPNDIMVESVTGSLRLRKGQDNFAAQVQVLVAQKASKDTARRVAASRERRARAGKFGGGKRPFGFAPDGVTVDQEEAKEIRAATHAVLAGMSLRSINQGLRDRGVPTSEGGIWSTASLKDILCRPRNAGILVYAGKELPGVKASWDPIVPEDEFRAVVAKLNVRKAAAGRSTRWLGSNLYRCTCGGSLQAHSQKGRLPRYRCRDTGRMGGEHTARLTGDLDEFVVKTIVSFCCRPDAMSRLRPGDLVKIDVDALRARSVAINEGLRELARACSAGRITMDQLLTFTELEQEKLKEIDEKLTAARQESFAAGLAQAGAGINSLDQRRARVRAEWDSYAIASQRAILKELMTVHVLKAKPGPGAFDPSRLRIEWNQ